MSNNEVPGKVNGTEVYFDDTTLRDGVQSLWSLWTNHSLYEAVCPLIEQAGYATFENMVLAPEMVYTPFFAHKSYADPWETVDYLRNTFQNTPINHPANGLALNPMLPPLSTPLFKWWAEFTQRAWKGKIKHVFQMCLIRDEIQYDMPIVVPIWRSLGVEVVPYITYFVSSRHTDELYAQKIKEVLKFRPPYIVLKDVGGLLTIDRARTLIPTFINNAPGIPIEMHLHGMSGFHEAVAVEAMKLGVRRFQTCIPPLSNGSSHINIFNVARNARTLGLKPMINEEPLIIASERLTTIGQTENLPLGGTGLLYDERNYSHRVPGGVINNLITQLKVLKMEDRLDEVLDEVPRILKELGEPIMITPHSQFIVTQAALHVSTGERWEMYIDAMVEYAVGVYGEEDCGPKYMDQNLRDKLLSDPKAKKIKEKWETKKEEDLREISRDEYMKSAGVKTESEFWLKYWNVTPEQMEKVKALPPSPKYNFRR